MAELPRFSELALPQLGSLLRPAEQAPSQGHLDTRLCCVRPWLHVCEGLCEAETGPGGRAFSHLNPHVVLRFGLEVLLLRDFFVFNKTLGTVCPEERVVVSRVNAPQIPGL